MQQHAWEGFRYGVATVSRIDKIIGLFCKRTLYKRRYSAKETYHLIDPTNRSHPKSITLPFDSPENTRVHLHDNPPGHQRVSDPSTGNQRMSTPADSLWHKSKMLFGSVLMVQIKEMTGTGVVNPPTGSVWRGS